MRRTIAIVLFIASLAAGPAFGAPTFQLRYVNGIPRVEIDGDFRHSRYTVWRAASAQGPFARVTDGDVLCLGPCFADDYSAIGGRTYWYRFDVLPPEGGPVSHGPFEATISRDQARPLSAGVAPNPGRGATQVTLFVAGSQGASVHTDAALFDLQGRRLSTIHRGPLGTGLHRVAWNGRSDDGAELRAGLYLLRAVTADGRHCVTRVVRTR
ncbi:MAG TPA: FlgD immunoglobulin-like domain containing protein [Candidatus Eisenbacteria bacterium]|nr:FlgD immunoglobulin-like domain containing protein [Candidatus Eisenbacteria bacterium]